MLRILGVVFIFLGCQIFNTTTLHLKYKDAPKNSALKIAFTLNPPKIFFNTHFVPPFYQKEFKKALIQQIAYFLKDKKGFTLNVSGNVFFLLKKVLRILKRLKKGLKRLLSLTLTLNLSCVF